MNKIKFISHKNHDIHEYHFSSKDNDKIINDSEYFFNNKSLWDDWCKIEGMPLSYEKFNITNFRCGENILIYMLLISELTVGTDLYGVGIWETDTIEKTLNQKPILVNWEYQLEHEFCDQNKYYKNDIGYIKAKSPVIKQYGKAINNTPIDKTGLFKIETFQALTDFLKPGFGDNNNMTNFYSTNNISNIIEILTSSEVPVIADLLTTETLLIALLVGEDHGYYDYFLIKSKNDISIKIDHALNKIHSFVKFYTEEIIKVTNSNEMIKLIEKGLKKYYLL